MCTKYQCVLLLYEYSYLVAIPECCISERVVSMNLNVDDAIVKDGLTGNIQDINHLKSYEL